MGIGGVNKRKNSNSNCNSNHLPERMEIDDRYPGLPQSSPTPPLKTKHFNRCFSSCFRPSSSSSSDQHQNQGYEKSSSRLLVRTTSSTASWVRAKVNELPEGFFFCKCAGFNSPRRHQRRHSAEFRYDPLSYSLNFDEGAPSGDQSPTSAAEHMRYRCFSSRLPASPPSYPKSTSVRVIEGNAAALRFSS